MWTYNKNIFLLLITQLFIVGCSTSGSLSDLHSRSMNIAQGISKADVMALMGAPGDRSFRGKGEAWQYCSTGFASDDYITVWFYNGIVEGLTTYSRAEAFGICTQTFSNIDWGQAPDDLKIKLTIR